MSDDSYAAIEPRLSFVVAARNDDYGGGLLQRVQTFVNALSAQVERHRLPSELVLVDWNSETPMTDVITWPQPTGWLDGRVIVVPPEVHGTMPFADELTFREMPAKNVGIRRARAPFVLATNVDDIFSDRLFRGLTRPLHPGRFYRTDRHDTLAAADPSKPLDDLLASCREAVVLRHDLLGETSANGSPRDGGRPLLARAPLRRPVSRLARATRAAPATIARHARNPRRLVRVARERWVRELGLHTDASGDFTLLAKRDWERMDGYPELPGHHVHVDGIFLYECHNAGLQQVFLPGPLYHLEHGRSRPPTDDRQGDRRGLAPWISTRELYELTLAAARTSGRVLPHRDDWGLAMHDLDERRVM
jgi:hypothetical protein